MTAEKGASLLQNTYCEAIVMCEIKNLSRNLFIVIIVSIITSSCSLFLGARQLDSCSTKGTRNVRVCADVSKCDNIFILKL